MAPRNTVHPEHKKRRLLAAFISYVTPIIGRRVYFRYLIVHYFQKYQGIMFALLQ